MASDTTIEGRCLCGAVTLIASDVTPTVSACHCEMCRKWSTVFSGFVAQDVQVTGPVQTYQSSSFATRAFCKECGSHLWFRDTGKEWELAPGIFPDAANFPLVREVYSDCAFASMTLAGAHLLVTRAEYEADKPHVKGDAT